MYVDFDTKTQLYCVYNNRDLIVASFASYSEACRYLEQ